MTRVYKKQIGKFFEESRLRTRPLPKKKINLLKHINMYVGSVPWDHELIGCYTHILRHTEGGFVSFRFSPTVNCVCLLKLKKMER